MQQSTTAAHQLSSQLLKKRKEAPMMSNLALLEPSTASGGNCIFTCFLNFLLLTVAFFGVKSTIRGTFLSTRYPSGWNSRSVVKRKINDDTIILWMKIYLCDPIKNSCSFFPRMQNVEFSMIIEKNYLFGNCRYSEQSVISFHQWYWKCSIKKI